LSNLPIFIHLKRVLFLSAVFPTLAQTRFTTPADSTLAKKRGYHLPDAVRHAARASGSQKVNRAPLPGWLFNSMPPP
jgi:hypothetical protein